MKLNDEEKHILAGQAGSVPQQALQHQIKVGEFFGAEDMVPVTQAHLMADTESLGEAGVRWLEGLAATTAGRRHVRISTITDPRGNQHQRIVRSLAHHRRRASGSLHEPRRAGRRDRCLASLLPDQRRFPALGRVLNTEQPRSTVFALPGCPIQTSTAPSARRGRCDLVAGHRHRWAQRHSTDCAARARTQMGTPS